MQSAFQCHFYPHSGRGAVARGKGRTPPSRAAGAAKTPSGGSRGKTSPTKPTTAPARGAVRGAGRITAGKTTGVYCYLVGHCRFVDCEEESASTIATRSKLPWKLLLPGLKGTCNEQDQGYVYADF